MNDRRELASDRLARERTERLIDRALVAWAMLGGAPLIVYFLHAPGVTSRYQLDLAPAIAALLVITWRHLSVHWPRGGFAVLMIAWGVAIGSSKMTRSPAVGDPVGRGEAATKAYEISRAVGYDHVLPPAYDQADPWLPMWTDVISEYARCTDAFGAAIACDAPPMPGDVAVHGTRIEQQWLVVRETIPDDPIDPVCRLDDDDRPLCPIAPTVLTDEHRVLDVAYAPAPVLYENGFGWNLANGRVPPATLFYVTDPQFIALDISGSAGTDWDHAVRVAIGLVHLQLVSVAETSRGVRLRFAWASPSPHAGLQVAFVTFGPDTELDREESDFTLRSIRWRDD